MKINRRLQSGLQTVLFSFAEADPSLEAARFVLQGAQNRF